MKFFFKKLNKNLIVSWGLSYMLIIMILVGVITVIVGMYKRTFEKESSVFNNYVFENVTTSANDVLMSISNLHLNLVRNERLTGFIKEPFLDYYSNETTYNLLEDIGEYNEFALNTDLFYIYIKETDSVLSSHGIVNSQVYHSAFFPSDKLSYDDWKQTMVTNTSDHFMTMFYKDNEGNEVEALSFLFHLPLDDESKAIGVILSDKRHFVEGIKDIGWKNLCDIYIYNTGGNLVIHEKWSAGEDMPQTLKQVENYKNDKHTVYTSDVLVNKNNWKVVTIVQNDALNRRITIIHLITYTITFAALSCLFFLVRFMIRLHYYPIKTMLSLFGTTTNKNEYDALYESINKVLDKNKRLTSDSESNRKKLMAQTLSRVIKGNLSALALEQNKVDFKGEYFAVLSFYLADISELFCEDADMADYERHFHLSYIIGNVTEELFAVKGFDLYTTEIDELIVCLINLPEKLGAKELMPLAEEGLGFINENFEISLTFALSDVYKGLTNISQAYGQALEVLEYKRILEIDEPMMYAEITVSSSRNYIFNLHKEQALINSIKSGNREDALALVEKIFEDLGSDKSMPPDYISYVVLDIASTITKSVNEIMSGSFHFDTELTLYKNIKNSESLGNIYQQIIEYIEIICDNIDSDIEEKKSRAHHHVSEIVKYVHAHFTNPDLNISSIGHHFNLTPSYISRIFKEQKGISLVDFINMNRIERSRELIKSGMYSIKEVSKMVGFSNERTFYRIQKKFGRP